MAAALFLDHLRRAGLEATVHSAGTRREGQPATDHGVAVMAERGLDTSGHRSRRLTSELAQGADLIVGMAREHVREAVAVWPGAWPRAFTLKELVRRGEQAGPPAAGQPLADWVARLHAARRPDDLMGRSTSDDVEDPVTKPRKEYERTAGELDDLAGRLVRLLVPLAAEKPPGTH
jgi:protein-tyrosine phosphatase